jgi:hypothetical protein
MRSRKNWIDMNWELCEGIVLSCCVQSNSNTWSEESLRRRVRRKCHFELFPYWVRGGEDINFGECHVTLRFPCSQSIEIDGNLSICNFHVIHSNHLWIVSFNDTCLDMIILWCRRVSFLFLIISIHLQTVEMRLMRLNLESNVYLNPSSLWE